MEKFRRKPVNRRIETTEKDRAIHVVGRLLLVLALRGALLNEKATALPRTNRYPSKLILLRGSAAPVPGSIRPRRPSGRRDRKAAVRQRAKLPALGVVFLRADHNSFPKPRCSFTSFILHATKGETSPCCS